MGKERKPNEFKNVNVMTLNIMSIAIHAPIRPFNCSSCRGTLGICENLHSEDFFCTDSG